MRVMFFVFMISSCNCPKGRDFSWPVKKKSRTLEICPALLSVVLSAVEISSDQSQHFILLSVDVGTECLVAIRTELVDDAINHSWAEHVMLFENITLLFEAGS